MMESGSTVASFTIEDDMANAHLGAIEVRIALTSGPDRWCFFMTPSSLVACGDFLPGTKIRIHIGEPHMIVVSEIDEAVIKRSIELLDKTGELLSHTLTIGA